MADEKTVIKITPTPAVQDISRTNLLRLSRITKLPPEKVSQRISAGKSIAIVTSMHPKLEDVANLIRGFGFSVTISPVEGSKASPPAPAASSAAATVEASEWKVGDVIENLYEVRDIKYGGMGNVYLVRHRRWDIMMAVKSLLHRLRGNEEDRALFLKEAETWIDVGFHPNIAACYYVRNIHESPRIFIEYVDGGALNEWLVRQSPVAWDMLIDLMVQFSDGLEHAHSKGLVHRDVKPGNCMMTRDGILKVTDFGLTKRQDQSRGNGETFDASESGVHSVLEKESVTAAGMGTPSYMAPEMWIPHAEVGPPVDIYAFGVMFFEICCGRKPFVIQPGEKRGKLGLAHVKKTPPRPRSLRSSIPRSIENLILKCLNKNPADRYGSFREIRGELAQIYEEIYKRRFPREMPDEVKLFSDALNNRAVSLMDLNHEDEAENALMRAVESDPHHPEAVYNLGLLDWYRTKNPDWELVKRMEEVVKTPEYVGRGAYLLGRCLLALGDARRALTACELAISSEDAGEAWLKHCAVALIGTGNELDAIKHLETYLIDFPEDEEAAGWLIGAMVRNGRLEEARDRIKSFPGASEIGRMEPEEISRKFLFSGLTETSVLRGHGGWVTCMAQSQKSNLLITGARDRTIKIWNAETGEEKKTLNVVGEPPAALWVSPNEQLLAIASSQSGIPVKILNLQSGRFVGNLIAHGGVVTAAGFSPDGKHILTVEQAGVTRLWGAEDFKAAATFKIPAHSAAALAFDGDSKPIVFISGMDRIVKKILPLDSVTETFERGHRELVVALKVDPEGRRAVTCGRDKQTIIWDAREGKIVTVSQAHQDPVAAVALNPVMHLAASYDAKGGIKVWDDQSGIVHRTFSTCDSEVNCLEFTPDGERLLAGGKDMCLRIWDVRGRLMFPNMALAKIRPIKKQIKSDRKFKAMVDAAKKAMKRGAFSTAYSMLRESQVLPGYERSDIALDLIVRMRERGKRVGLHGGWNRKTCETPSGVMDVSFSPSAINFLTAQADHTIGMWNTKRGDCVKTLKGHTNLVAAICFSSNGREAASGSDDRSVRLWDLQTGKMLLTLKGHTESVSSVAFSRDGSALLSGSWDKTVRLWRLPDGGLIKTLKGHEDKITAVKFVRGAEHIASAGFDGVVKIWEASSGRLLRELRGHRDKIMSLDVSPDGHLLASGSTDGNVKVWDLRRGTCLKTLEGGKSGVRAAVFSPDQNFLAVGGYDTILRIWKIDNSACLREFQGHSREISSVDFSSNGRFVISSSTDGSVMIWELDWEWRFGDTKGEGTREPVR
jgi:WD40 repeat protein/serine/threonine protein kinase